MSEWSQWARQLVLQWMEKTDRETVVHWYVASRQILLKRNGEQTSGVQTATRTRLVEDQAMYMGVTWRVENVHSDLLLPRRIILTLEPLQ